MTESVRARFEVVNARGMHARAATKLVQVASQYPCEIELVGPDGETVDARSVMDVLLLCGAKGTVVEVQATGERAAEAVEAIGELFAQRYGESE